MTVSDVISCGSKRILSSKIQCADPELHMRQILEHVLGWNGSQVYMRWSEELSATDQKKIESFLMRRLSGEPFQYIAGEEGFWNSTFKVGPGVLIPRKETELLVETLLREEKREQVEIAELGPGSGNIGISILQERPRWKWTGFEKNPDTLRYLEENVRTLVPNPERYRIVAGDFFEKVQTKYDWLVANPPYIPSGEIEKLAGEVQREPRVALEGGPTGLEVIEKMVKFAPQILKAGGGILFEIGYDQSDATKRILASNSFDRIKILKDYAGHDRAVIAFVTR